MTEDDSSNSLSLEHHLHLWSIQEARLRSNKGALIDGATPADLSALAAYARALGVAYQIHDDIADWEQSRTIMLDLKDTHCSQNEYLFETAKGFILEAIDSLQPLKSSEQSRT